MNEESEKTSLKQLIQGMTEAGITVIQGKVVAASPLKIQAVNDEKLTISQNSLFIPRHLTDYTTSCAIGTSGSHGGHNSGNGAHGHNASITIYNALKVGETVHLLSFNHGKQYYVLDRV